MQTESLTTAPQSNALLGYYRFPTIRQGTIVLTAEGDLWRVDIGGGLAQRITTHHGVESHAAISPDGTTIAFSAQYEGPTEVYVMPIQGGLPTRCTYEGEAAIVVGWTPCGRILYRTRHYSTLPNVQLATFDPRTHEQALIPLAQASDGTFSANGSDLFFTRFNFQGSHTKRYKGGWIENIWKFTLDKPADESTDEGGEMAEAVPLTSDYLGTSKAPMWWAERIYFASDRDGTMNLWSMDEIGENLQQHTFHSGWDVQSPSLDQGRIVYQLGADLYLFDVATDETKLLSISLSSDLDQRRDRWIKNPMHYLTGLDISPTGDRVALTARGHIFVAPVEQGRLVEVTHKAGVRYRNAQFFPDGKSLFALSDETGELEFRKFPANGVGTDEALTENGDVFRFSGRLSPDGKWIAHTDKNLQLWLHSTENRESIQIAVSEHRNFYNLNWSPDSQWLAYVAAAENEHMQIWLYHLTDGTITALTSDRVDSYSPTWSQDGRWLYFLSDRHFDSLVKSPWGAYQPEPYFERTTKIYMISLQQGNRSLFQPTDELADRQPQNGPPKPAPVEEVKPEEAEPEEVEPEADEVLPIVEGDVERPADEPRGEEESSEEEMVANAEGEEAEKKVDGEGQKLSTIPIDLDGIRERVMVVPLSAGNYTQLSVNGKFLFWMEIDSGPSPKRRLVALEIKNKEIQPKTLISDIKSYGLSLNGKKAVVHKGNAIYVIDAVGEPPKQLAKQRVGLNEWLFAIQPQEEWRQMFTEAWRLERDYFYDKNLHGIDWQGLFDKHLPLVERVTDREELNNLIGQLIGELAALHTYVRQGDKRIGADQIRLASLGATLTRDQAAGGYRVAHIFRSEPDYIEMLSPLAKPQSKVAEGDIIVAINGIPLLDVTHPALLLKNKINQQVLLTVKSAKSASSETSFDRIVNPISAAQAAHLRYDEWEYQNRLKVDAQSDNQIGYVHLRAMRAEDYAQWMRHFYAVFNRDGLILDARNNRGGNIDSWILEKLMRRAWFYWQPRVGKPYWNMQYAFRGHLVVLCNEQTCSDGETLVEGIRRLGLGKIIGTRTWGGEIWLSMNTWLVDKGIASAAEIGVYGPEGEWLIEGHGVEPDRVVDNLPHATFQGQDAQLDAALSYLQEQIRLNPVPVPPPPVHPNKSFRYDG